MFAYVCVCVCVSVSVSRVSTCEFYLYFFWHWNCHFIFLLYACDTLYRYPDMQASRPIYINNCALYCVKAFQIKSAVGQFASYVSVGVRLPNGSYDRPAHLKHFYWILPGECASGSITVCTMRKLVEI